MSLVPSLTETLFALGCGRSVVGVTRHCTEPAAELGHLTRVGGTKNPAIGRVLELAPDLVLMDRDENRKEDFDALNTGGVRVFVAEVHGVEDVVELLHDIGSLTGTQGEARRRAASLRRTLASEAGQFPLRPRVFCPIWKNPWMSFNGDTYPGSLLRIAGADNVCAARTNRYCTLDLGEMRTLRPDVILLPDEPYRFRPRDLESLAPVVQHSAAWGNRRVHFFDGKALTWFGVRTESGLRMLRSLLARTE